MNLQSGMEISIGPDLRAADFRASMPPGQPASSRLHPPSGPYDRRATTLETACQTHAALEASSMTLVRRR